MTNTLEEEMWKSWSFLLAYLQKAQLTASNLRSLQRLSLVGKKNCSKITSIIIHLLVHILLPESKLLISNHLDLGSEVGFRRQREGKEDFGSEERSQLLQQYLKHFYSPIIVPFGKNKLTSRHFLATVVPWHNYVGTGFENRKLQQSNNTNCTALRVSTVFLFSNGEIILYWVKCTNLPSDEPGNNDIIKNI